MSRIEVDYNRVAALLNAVEKISTVAPMYTAISGGAMAELKEINQKIADEAVKNKKEADRKAAEEAAKAAKAREERLAKEEADAKAAADRQAKAPRPIPPIVPGQPVPPEAHPIVPEPVVAHEAMTPDPAIERKV